LLKIELPRGVFLNVNVPNLPLEQLKGLKITKRGFKHYVGPPEKRVDPQGRVYFWRGAEKPISELLPGTDVGEVAAGFASVTPLHVDTTFAPLLEELREWELSFSNTRALASPKDRKRGQLQSASKVGTRKEAMEK